MLIEIAQAAGNTSVFTKNMEIGDFILMGISIAVLFSGIFSIVYILRGGILLILSGGKEDKIKPAINSIRYALIGLVVIILSIFVFPKLASLLGLDVNKYSSPNKIFSKIEELGNKIFKSKSSTTIDIDDIDSLPDDFSDL